MWARVEDDIVMEMTGIDPEGRFHQDLVWVPCERHVKTGWRYFEGTFVEPVEQLEVLLAAERAWRDAQLNATEWIVSRHRDDIDMQRETTLTAEQYVELLTYRQALRDWLQSQNVLIPSERPEQPIWIREHLR